MSKQEKFPALGIFPAPGFFLLAQKDCFQGSMNKRIARTHC
jgi:hypothetical protein